MAIDDDDTLDKDTLDMGDVAASESVSVSLAGVRERTFRDRYESLRPLGHGGMGEVLLCTDHQIGRQVALKVMRPSTATRQRAQERFVREARVQGQLEHPAIVPVYDLGRSDEELFFTMKRVRGETLEQIIEGLRDGVPDIEERYSRFRLLSAFASVCLAIDYAHQRGVLHRDLKPANVMLGGYGEVYVLDWGLARIGERDPSWGDESTELEVDTSRETHAGAVLGTPGYMSIEQARGLHDELTPASDVYSLGCVLYELLTYEPIIEEGNVTATLAMTVEGVDARASVRVPKALVPPELEAICRRATAKRPEDRYRSARALHDALDQFLAGQRDSTMRRQASGKHAERAEAAMAARENTIEVRRTAMREIGRALALDPENERALEIMTSLLTEPPSKLPPEVVLEIERANADKVRWSGRIGMWTYGSMVLYLPLLLWVGVRDWAPMIAFYALAAVCAGLSGWAARARRPRVPVHVAVMLLSNVMFTMLWFTFGPLLALPPILVANTVAFAVQLGRPYRLLAIAAGSLCIAVPMLLELVGVIEPTFHFVGSEIVVHWGVLTSSSGATLFFFGSISVAAILTSAMSLMRMRDALDDAERRLYVYAWHLREVVPAGIRASTDPTILRQA